MFDFKRVSERGATMRIGDGPGEVIIHHVLFTENGYIFPPTSTQTAASLRHPSRVTLVSGMVAGGVASITAPVVG